MGQKVSIIPFAGISHQCESGARDRVGYQSQSLPVSATKTFYRVASFTLSSIHSRNKTSTSTLS